MLTRTPYLLEGASAESVVKAIEKLDANVARLRRSGALDEKTLDQLRREWRIEQVYETTGIEGNSLDVNETRLVLERGVTISGKPERDSTDALNMAEALDYLETLTRSEALSPRDIREIQQLVLGEAPGAGAYRTTQVKISGAEHVPPPASEITAQVEDLVRWVNDSTECPVPLRAAVAHAWLTHIHPFRDGNGRTARAVSNLILIKGGYPIVLIRRKDRTRYYDALAASDEGDIAPLLDLIIKRSEDSLRQVVRARAEATGVSEALRQAEERVAAQYNVWHQAMLLLLRSIEEVAEQVREQSDGNLDIAVREYDQVTLDDYKALLRRDKSGNGWLAALRGRGYTKSSELLLWNGFRSVEMRHQLGTEASGASIFVSEQDPMRIHGPFRPLAETSEFGVKEIAFDGGSYYALGSLDGGSALKKMKSNELASRIVKEFFRVYLT